MLYRTCGMGCMCTRINTHTIFMHDYVIRLYRLLVHECALLMYFNYVSFINSINGCIITLPVTCLSLLHVYKCIVIIF